MRPMLRFQEKYLGARRRWFGIDSERPLPKHTRILHGLLRLLDIGLTVGSPGVPVRFQHIRDWTFPEDANQYTPARLYIEDFLSAWMPELFPPGRGRERLLDIGCGDGRYVSVLRDPLGFRNGWGLDITLREAWRIGAGSQYIVADAERLPFSPNRAGFDMIISIHTLEHVRDDGLVLNQVASLLSPNGVGVFMVPSTSAFLLYGFHGFRGYSPKTFAHLCNESGLRLRAVYRQGGVLSFLFHLFAISGPEIYSPLFGVRFLPRIRGRKGFRRMVVAVAKLDPLLPFLPSSYVFVVSRDRGDRAIKGRSNELHLPPFVS